MEYTYHVFLLLGGIAMFLYGINYMSQSLYEALGDNLRLILEKLTTKPLHAVMLGLIVTALIQSSGATMVMVTGFVAAQLMTLSQGMFVMMGAAIGTTVTAQIIAFSIEPWAPLILFVGVVMYLFIKKRVVKRAGAVILGFGTLFMGIYLMGEAIDRMSLGVVIEAFLNNFSHPALALLLGFVITFIIQSSSASIGILQVLLAGTPDFSLAAVAYIIIGMNVGAVAPVVIASLAGNKAGKRTAVAAVITKLLSAAVFIVLLLIFPKCIDIIASISPGDASRQIANFHLIFNVAVSITLFFAIKPLAKILMQRMPDDPDDTRYSKKLLYIGKGQDKAPAVMIAQCRQELFRFAELVQENYHKAMDAFSRQDIELAEEVKQREETINYLNRAIYDYLLNLHGKLLPSKDIETLAKMFNILIDLERIGDHAENISEYTIISVEHHASVSMEAWEELQDMGWSSVQIVDDAVRAYKQRDVSLVGKVQLEEDMIDKMKLKLENAHIERMRRQTCDPRGGTLFIDIIVDYERVADHALNIAETILRVKPES